MKSRSNSWLVPVLLALPLFFAGCGKEKDGAASSRAQAEPAPRARVEPLPQADPINMAVLQPVLEEFKPDLEASEALMRQGLLDDPAAAILKRLGPEEEASPARLMAAANFLYKFAPKDSFRLHMKVVEKEPASLLANLEAGYELHRAGRYAEACPYWEKVSATDPSRKFAGAMLAHCRLAGGDVKGAQEAWPRFGGEHQQLESSLSEIFGPPAPMARRKELLDAVASAADKDGPVCDLIVHDLNWRTDWWNVRANVTQASADLKKFSRLISPNARLPLEILVRSYATVREEEQSLPEDEVRRIHAVLSKYPGRVKTPVLRQLVAISDETKIFTKADMHAWLGGLLRERLNSPDGTADDGILLASLSDGVDPGLMQEADAKCAELFDHKNCVVSTLISKQMSERLTFDDALLQKTLKDHPDWVHPHMLAMSLVPKDQEKDMLRRLILAEFHELETGSPLHGPHNATGLMGLFAELGKK